jgi:hypothetical protein
MAEEEEMTWYDVKLGTQAYADWVISNLLGAEF